MLHSSGSLHPALQSCSLQCMFLLLALQPGQCYTSAQKLTSAKAVASRPGLRHAWRAPADPSLRQRTCKHRRLLHNISELLHRLRCLILLQQRKCNKCNATVGPRLCLSPTCRMRKFPMQTSRHVFGSYASYASEATVFQVWLEPKAAGTEHVLSTFFAFKPAGGNPALALTLEFFQDPWAQGRESWRISC